MGASAKTCTGIKAKAKNTGKFLIYLSFFCADPAPYFFNLMERVSVQKP
ncbi:hypothetical protein Z947_3428 [Sulfitobacter geojensis]|nr:hypothetical protein Z947_3428 [Sulfitobacter geojensis]